MIYLSLENLRRMANAPISSDTKLSSLWCIRERPSPSLTIFTRVINIAASSVKDEGWWFFFKSILLDITSLDMYVYIVHIQNIDFAVRWSLDTLVRKKSAVI